MCLICYLPQGEKLDIDRMAGAFKSNGDGWGIMAAVEDRLEIRKLAVPRAASEAEAFEKFLACYKELADYPMGIHFRNRTHGAIDLDNTHPYPVMTVAEGDGADVYLMHNGVMSSYGTYAHNGRSDTGDFIDKRLQPMLRKLGLSALEEPNFQHMLAQYVGANNKMLVMSPALSEPVILNRAAGKDEGKIWYSNGYVAYKAATTGNIKRFHGTHFHGPWDEGGPHLPLARGSAGADIGGSSKSVVPFSPTTSSNDASAVSSTKSEKSSEPVAITNQTPTTDAEMVEAAQRMSDAEFRRLLLDGPDDPRVNGNEVCLECLRYMEEPDLEAMVQQNVDGLVDFLIELRDSFEKGVDDIEFRLRHLSA